MHWPNITNCYQILLEIMGVEFNLTDDTLKFSNLEKIHNSPIAYMARNDPPYTKDMTKRLESIENLSLEKMRNEIRVLKFSDRNS